MAATVVVPVLSLLPSLPAGAAEPDRVHTVADRVRVLTAEYRARSALAESAAHDLAVAFAAGSRAETARTTADAELLRAQVRRSARVRALYAEGTDGFALAVLTAGSTDDALWRLATADRLRRTLLARDGEDVGRTLARARTAAASADRADAAVQDVAQAVGRLQDESARAQRALADATVELATLTAEQQRLAAARQAALALAAAQANAEAARLAAAGPLTALDVPAEYEQAYRASAPACAGLRWTLLAAVGQVESGHGRNDGPSSAGAVGPMQFMPATFALYGLDGDGDGRADPWNFRDAIPSAARYLCASGIDGTASGDQRALLAYNHAQWYVDLVLGAERAILTRAAGSPSGQSVGAAG